MVTMIPHDIFIFAMLGSASIAALGGMIYGRAIGRACALAEMNDFRKRIRFTDAPRHRT